MMTEFEAQVLSDLRVLKSQMDQLMGIGQPGRLIQIEERIQQHERGMQRMRGFVSAVSAAMAMLHFAIDFFRRG
jgi:hypothetical protein